MIIETFLFNKLKKEHFENENKHKNKQKHKKKDKLTLKESLQKCNIPKMQFMLLVLSKLISMTIAIYLAWNCNKNSKSLFYKILIVLIAVIFSDIYILFYIVYRLILKNNCN